MTEGHVVVAMPGARPLATATFAEKGPGASHVLAPGSASRDEEVGTC